MLCILLNIKPICCFTLPGDGHAIVDQVGSCLDHRGIAGFVGDPDHER